jgi:hypothetical protein
VSRAVSAVSVMPVDHARAFSLLADLDEHWRFASDFVDVIELYGPAGARQGGLLRLRGPFGLRRTVRTRLVHASAPGVLAGVATAGRHTTASIAWHLAPSPFGVTVELKVTIVHAGRLDRALLRFGGRRWLRRQLATTVQRFSFAAQEVPRPRLAA